MKHSILIPLLLLSLHVSAYAAERPNLLDEPGFEGRFEKGVAAGWRRFPIRGSVQGTFSASNLAHGGQSSQQLEVSETMDGWLQLSAPIRGGLVGGRDYEARVWLRGDRALHNMCLVVHDATDWFPKDFAATGCNAGQGWREAVLRFRAPRTVDKAFFAVRLVQEGRLWVDDASLTELPPPQARPPRPGNLVRNGSFEVGLAGWAPRVLINLALEEDPAAPHGRRCLAFTPINGGDLSSVLMNVEPARSYTLSLWLRAARPGRVRVLLRSGYAEERPAGPETVSSGPETIAAVQTFEATTQWQRFSLSAELPPTENGAYYLTLRPPSGVRTWLDAVQLEEGGAATPFHPRAEVEAALETGRENGLYTRGDKVAGRLVIWNDGRSARRLDLSSRIVDVWEKKINEQPLAIDAAPGRSETALDLTPGERTGAFRAECTAGPGVAPPYAETVFAVLPQMPALDGAASPLGTHVDFSSPTRPAAAGARWTKTWWLNWSESEPQPGVWRFSHDGLVDTWTSAGLNILGVLGGIPEREQLRPADALPWGWYPARDDAKLKDYARRVVEHYRGRIHAWEIMNEPNFSIHTGSKDQSSAQAYAKMWRAMAEGIRAADPGATIVTGSITLVNQPAEWLREVAAADPGLLELCDAVSYHNYTDNPESIARYTGRLRAELERLGKPKAIWDTEWSPVKTPQPFYRDAPRNLSLESAPARTAAAMVVRGFVARIGAGTQRAFLYHGYGSAAMDRYEFDMFTELGGGPRPIVAAHGVLAAMLNGARLERAEPIEDAWAWRFRRADGKAMVIAWARATAPGTVPLKLSGRWRASDMMGNPAGGIEGTTAGGYLLNEEPVYLLQE